MKHWVELKKIQLEKFGFTKNPDHQDFNVYGIKSQIDLNNQYDLFSFFGINSNPEETILYFWLINEFAIEEKVNPFEEKCIGELKLSLQELFELITILKSNQYYKAEYSNVQSKSLFQQLVTEDELKFHKVNLRIQEQYKIKPKFYAQKRTIEQKYSLLRSCYEFGISLILHEIHTQARSEENFNLNHSTIGRISLTRKEFHEFVDIIQNFHRIVSKNSRE